MSASALPALVWCDTCHLLMMIPMQQPQDHSTSLTPVSRLGEFGLIEYLTRRFSTRRKEVRLGLGDDAAVIDIGQGRVQVVSTDMLLENVHFDLSYVPLRHLGYKAVVVNLSDIVAMNAVPLGITMSIAMSSRFSVEALDELYAGIALACERYDVDLLGGDTTSSKQGLMLSVTALGEAHQDDISYRSGAKPGDLVCLSGDVGGAYAGLLVLDREKSVYQQAPGIQPDISDYDYVVGRQLKPEARLDVISKLRSAGLKPTSMIDVSDGVASELHHLCHQSKTGVSIYSHKLPIDFQTTKVAEEFKISPTTFAMNGGEDYELLFTLPISAFEAIKSWPEITVIGKMTDDQGLLSIVLESGQVSDIEAQGWQHFKVAHQPESSSAETEDDETSAS
jgi:thiamine-monophosphate kinase